MGVPQYYSIHVVTREGLLVTYPLHFFVNVRCVLCVGTYIIRKGCSPTLIVMMYINLTKSGMFNYLACMHAGSTQFLWDVIRNVLRKGTRI